MKSLYRKELYSYFYTPNGYICIFLILLFSGIFFSVLNISEPNGSFESTASMISYVFLLAVPIITMKSYAAEKESDVFNQMPVLTCNPIKTALAKYLAMLTVFAVPFLFIGLFPIFIAVNGGGDLIWSVCCILGTLLFGLFLIAVGMFVSSLAPNQTVSAIVTFALLFFLYIYQTIRVSIPYDEFTNLIIAISLCLFIGAIMYLYSKYLPTSILFVTLSSGALMIFYLIDSSLFYGLIYNIITFLSPLDGFYTFISGIFSLQYTVYYLTFTILFVLLTAILPHNKGVDTKYVFDEHKNAIKKTNKEVAAYHTVICILITVSIIGVNLIFAALPVSAVNYDVTGNRYHSLSNKAEKIVDNISSSIKIYHLSSKENRDESLSLLLENISKENGLISNLYVDTDLNPKFYKPFTDTPLTDNSIIITGDHSSAIIRSEDMYLYGITFMDNQVATELNYDSASQTCNAYINAYLEDYGIDVSGYISYYPTHLVREKAILSAMTECIGSDSTATDNISPVSIYPPEPEFSENAKLVLPILFSVILPAIPLILGITIVNIRRLKSSY